MKKPIPILPGMPLPAAAPVRVWPSLRLAAKLARDGEGEFFTINVRGESMTAAGIFDGDIVLCKSARTAKRGDIVISTLTQVNTGLPMIKRYIETASGQRWLVGEALDGDDGCWRIMMKSRVIAVVQACLHQDGSVTTFLPCGDGEREGFVEPLRIPAGWVDIIADLRDRHDQREEDPELKDDDFYGCDGLSGALFPSPTVKGR